MGKIGARLSRVCGIEESIIGGAPKLTAVGNRTLRVENHGGLAALTGESIYFVNGVKVEGAKLEIKEMDAETADIEGEISCIKIEKS